MITSLALSPSLDITYLVDSLRVGDISRPREVHRVAGGKGLNVARAASTLGGQVRAVAPLGGHVGELLRCLLQEHCVHLVAVDAPGQTRSCISVAPDDDDRLTELYEPSELLPAESWDAVVRAVDELPSDPGGWLVLSGSIPGGVDLDSLVQLLATCVRAGYRLAVDSHGPALRAIVNGVSPHLVKVNRAEAVELLGSAGGSSLRELAEGIRARTGGLAAVTDGVDGSCAVDASGYYRVMLDTVPGRFAVGSGDSFLAGLLVGLSDSGAFGTNGDLRSALRLAAAAGSANASCPGAAVFDQARVERLAGRIVVRDI